ncbi:MAG: HlyD family efflux transporter periplasmic adaptor subunit [Candidatus Kapaibacterium sp.]|nr:MAG: HlyD family efflux transporter periplasmic adaptor subunit [Candidatus Kapabacteria bacterium]
MDREFSPELQRSNSFRSVLKFVVPLALVGAAVVYGAGMIAPSLDKTAIRTATVERGAVEAVIEASGVVVPEIDRVLTSPIDARVLRILKRAGDSVSKGEAIVTLDLAASTLALEKLSDNIARKANQQAQLAATLEGRLIKLDNQIRLKRRDVTLDSIKFLQNRALFEKTYISQQELNQFDTQLQKSRDELDAFLKEYANAKAASKLEQEGVALEITSLRKDKNQSRRELDQAAARAESSGILTWVVQTEGMNVGRGTMLARIADLSSYRIDASISDIHRERMSVGLPAKVRVGETSLEGVISSVLPTIDNGVLKFTITLGGQTNAVLRPNLQADVFIQTARNGATLRVKKGAFVRGAGEQVVFVMQRKGNSLKAERRTVRIGLIGADTCEILSGLQAGDEVIISNMSEYQHLTSVAIK